MQTSLDRYKKDLESLVGRGHELHLALRAECNPEGIRQTLRSRYSAKETAELMKVLPSFDHKYQAWYSEATALIRQLLPDRLLDFTRLYEKPKSRKEITFENYRIEDCLQGLTVTRGYSKEKIASPASAIPLFRQQLAIVEAVKARFETSLFDIRQLVQADLFDSELEAAGALAKSGFARAAGAMAGVVLERHLGQVCGNHRITIQKKAPGISGLNDALKNADVLDVAQWRFIQHLGDIRNACDHSKSKDPSLEQVNDLIAGVAKITKTVY